MRIVYIGNVDFSYECLKTIIHLQGDVVGVVTKKENAYNSDFKNLSEIAMNNNIPYCYFENINSFETIEWIKQLKPDIIFCFGISSLIKEELLNIAPMGVVGFHPALLPYNRGRHPIIWAIVLGLKETGSTFFFMDRGADSGDILSQEKINISEDDDATSLYCKIKNIAQEQIKVFLPQLINGTYKREIQNHEKANYWRKRSFKDGQIDWRMGKRSIINLVKALNKPYPGATFVYKDENVVVWKVREHVCENENIESGKIIKIIEGRPVIKCYDGAIELMEFSSEVKFEIGDYIV